MKSFASSAMIKRFVIALFFIFTYCTSDAGTQAINIPSANHLIHLSNYRITKAVDMRMDQSRIGYLRLARFNKYVNVDFEHNLSDELMDFIHQNTSGSSPEEMTLYVYDYFLFENASFKGGEIALTIHFALYNKAGERLYDYRNTETNATGIAMQQLARQLLKNSMVHYLENTDENLQPILEAYKAKRTVAYSYKIVKKPDNKHYSVYDFNKLISAREMAGNIPADARMPLWVECGLDVSYQVYLVNGKPHILIQLLPYLDQEKSWIRDTTDLAAKMDYVNTFFKITAFVTNEFITALKSRSFTLNTIKNDIAVMQGRYMAEMHTLQERYIADTHFNSNPEEVDVWDRKMAFIPPDDSNW